MDNTRMRQGSERRKSAGELWCARLALAFVVGCGPNARSDATNTALDIAALGTACPHPVLERRELHVMASLRPNDRPGATEADGPLWSPTIITDLTTSGEVVFVVDGRQQEVTRLNAALEIAGVVGRRGAGPGEFLRPSAIGASSDGDVVVADPGTGRLTYIDPRTLRTRVQPLVALNRVSGIAVVDDHAYLTGPVVPEFLRRGARNGVALSAVRIDRDEVHDILDLATDAEAADALLQLPGPNPFRVVASSGVILLIAPAAGTIDLVEDGRILRRIEHCVPLALQDAYDRQRAAAQPAEGPRSQRMQPVVTDAMIHADTLFVVGPLPDEGGRLHVVKYTLDGRMLGSTAAALGTMPLPGTVRFWGDPYRLVAFDMQGAVLKVTVAK